MEKRGHPPLFLQRMEESRIPPSFSIFLHLFSIIFLHFSPFFSIFPPFPFVVIIIFDLLSVFRVRMRLETFSMSEFYASIERFIKLPGVAPSNEASEAKLHTEI